MRPIQIASQSAFLFAFLTLSQGCELYYQTVYPDDLNAPCGQNVRWAMTRIQISTAPFFEGDLVELSDWKVRQRITGTNVFGDQYQGELLEYVDDTTREPLTLEIVCDDREVGIYFDCSESGEVFQMVESYGLPTKLKVIDAERHDADTVFVVEFPNDDDALDVCGEALFGELVEATPF